MHKEIKKQFITKQISSMTAAKLLSRYNGNPLPGNLQIVMSWRRV